MVDVEGFSTRIRQSFEEADRASNTGSYAKLENNFGDWLSELRRIVTEITRRQDDSPSLDTASRMRALLRDGIRVAWDIHYYLEHKERIHAFTPYHGSPALQCGEEGESVPKGRSPKPRALAPLERVLTGLARGTGFTETTRELDREERHVLIDLLKHKLTSEQF